MGCCSSSEEEEDRRPVLQDNTGHGHTAPASGVPSDAVARLQKSFDEAEAEESARKASLLLKKEQQDRATRDALLGPAKKPKPVTIAAPPPIQASPVPQVSAPAPAPMPHAPPKAPSSSIALAPDTFDLAKSPVASPPPIASPVSHPPAQAAPAVTDDTLIALAQKQIAEENRKEQTLKQAESILAQVESEASTDLLRRSEARVQKGMSKAEQILAETETMQSEADLQKQKRRSVKLMQRAEDILAETESEPRPTTFQTPRRQPAAADPDFTPAALTPVTAPSPLPAATPATLAFAMTPAATPAAHAIPAEPTPPSPMPAAVPAAAATDTAIIASPAPGSTAPDTSNAHSNVASPALPADYDPEKYPKGKALYDYAARSENELTLKVDDILRIWEDKGDDWSLGEINGRSGYFPGNYVQRIRVTKRLTLKKIPSNKILELQAKTGLLDSEKPAQAEEDSSLV